MLSKQRPNGFSRDECCSALRYDIMTFDARFQGWRQLPAVQAHSGLIY